MQTPKTAMTLALALAMAMPAPFSLHAQDSEAPEAVSEDTAKAPEGEASTDAEADGEFVGLTDEELQTLVGPIALYPDTLLIQILVSATVPFDVMKADRFLLENPDAAPEDLSEQIEAQNWDESVEVLALGFPDVIGRMADHIEWTEALGTAMLAQQDDLLDAVQDLRDIALENGALETNEAVEVTQDEDENIIVVPAEPEIVYVPEYDPEVVYVTDNSSSSVGDAIATGLIIWGTFVVVDAIFGSSYTYWGCRNCCGWGGGNIYNDININIDRDNNVIGNRPGDDWRPRPEQRAEARTRVNDRRGPDGATNLPINRPSQSDNLRAQLSDRTGAPDISDRANRDTLPPVNRGGGSGADALRERSREGQALNRPANPASPSARPAEKPSLPTTRPQIDSRPSPGQRPAATPQPSRPSVSQPSARPAQSRPAASKAPAAKRSVGSGARNHSARGKASRGGARPARR